MINNDVFGIKELYPTSAYGFNGNILQRGGRGWEYYSEFWNQRRINDFIPNGTVIPQQTTDIFMHFSKVPNSFVQINGDGSITINTDERYHKLGLSIFDENNLYYGTKNALTTGKRWTSNIEFTFYFMIRAYPLRYGIKGAIEINLTSDLHFINNAIERNTHMSSGYNPYNSHAYSLVIQYDGHVYLSGIPYHGCVRDKKPDNIYNIDFWGTEFNGIPLNMLIGIKFVKRVVGSSKKDVFLEVHRDTTGGYNGGDWHKIIEFLHTRGNWYNTSMDLPYATSLANPSGSILPVPKNVDDPHADGGGGMCQIRLDPIHSIDLKWISCRDIEPDLRHPVTTDAELTSESEYYDDNESDIL